MVRILQGMIEGVRWKGKKDRIKLWLSISTGALYPSNAGIWNKFADVNSKSGLMTLSSCGNYVGFIIGLPVCGFLTHSIGWMAPFYLYGLLGLAWFAMFIVYITTFSRSMKTRERPPFRKVIRAPWCRILTAKVGIIMMPKRVNTCFDFSQAMWAICLMFIANDWVVYLMVSNSPQYFNDMFNLNTQQSSFYAALPHILKSILTPLGGQVADFLIRNKGRKEKCLKMIRGTDLTS